MFLFLFFLPVLLMAFGVTPWFALTSFSCAGCITFVYWRSAQSILELERERAHHSEEYQ